MKERVLKIPVFLTSSGGAPVRVAELSPNPQLPVCFPLVWDLGVGALTISAYSADNADNKYI